MWLRSVNFHIYLLRRVDERGEYDYSSTGAQTFVIFERTDDVIDVCHGRDDKLALESEYAS